MKNYEYAVFRDSLVALRYQRKFGVMAEVMATSSASSNPIRVSDSLFVNLAVFDKPAKATKEDFERFRVCLPCDFNTPSDEAYLREYLT